MPPTMVVPTERRPSAPAPVAKTSAASVAWMLEVKWRKDKAQSMFDDRRPRSHALRRRAAGGRAILT